MMYSNWMAVMYHGIGIKLYCVTFCEQALLLRNTFGNECLSSAACLYPPSRAASSPWANSLLFLPDNTSTEPATADRDWFSCSAAKRGSRVGTKEPAKSIFWTRTHLRRDAELWRQVEQDGRNILDHLYHQVFAAGKGQKSLGTRSFTNLWFCKLVGLADLWARWFPWRINASEVLSSGFTATEHLIWESVRRPQASTYISTQMLTQSSTPSGETFWVCFSLLVRQG